MSRRLVAILVIGAVARLVPYFRRPSLSIDEAMLSLSIASRSLAGLVHPLDYGQTAPPLYLWLTHGLTRVAGVNEMALRGLPLIAGLILPWAVWRLGRRLLTEGAGLFASLVVALAPGLVQYAVIVKPYAVDALVTVVLLEAALSVMERDDGPAWAWLIGLGVFGVGLSAPAPFVLATVGICLTLAKWRTRWPLLALAAALWLGLFLAIYEGMYRSPAADQFMQRFWAADFLVPAAFGVHGRAYGILRNSFLEALLLRPSPALVATLFCLIAVLGIAWVGLRKGWGRVWLLVGPVLMTGVASSFRRYPFSWRLLQFIVPLAALWITAGGVWLGEALSRLRHANWMLPAVAGAFGLALIVVNVSHPYRTQATRDLIVDWATRTGPRDPVYIFPGAVPTWAFYTADWAHPDSSWLAALESAHRSPQADLDLDHQGRRELVGHYTGIDWFAAGGATQPHPDVDWAGHEAHRILGATMGNTWLLFAQSYRDEVPSLLRALADSGMVRVYADSAPGAALYEYRR